MPADNRDRAGRFRFGSDVVCQSEVSIFAARDSDLADAGSRRVHAIGRSHANTSARIVAHHVRFHRCTSCLPDECRRIGIGQVSAASDMRQRTRVGPSRLCGRGVSPRCASVCAIGRLFPNRNVAGRVIRALRVNSTAGVRITTNQSKFLISRSETASVCSFFVEERPGPQYLVVALA